MRRSLFFVLAVFVLAAEITHSAPAAAETEILCTLLEEAGIEQAGEGRVLVEEGNCGERRAPASTFKIAIALMGYDAGILTAPHSPVLPFRKGYVDWREAWKEPSDPARWMRESVVWYSQQVTTRLGAERFQGYVDAFDYGNGDVTGDKGEGNGLTDAWLSSSLRISPREQVTFLQKLLAGALPVSAEAVENVTAIIDYGVRPGGWHVYGKTGTGLPRDQHGSLMWGHPFGWFVGWAEREGRTVVFARLIQESEKPEGSAGGKARDGLFAEYFDRNTGGVPE